jgi:hypothetical protein
VTTNVWFQNGYANVHRDNESFALILESEECYVIEKHIRNLCVNFLFFLMNHRKSSPDISSLALLPNVAKGVVPAHNRLIWGTSKPQAKILPLLLRGCTRDDVIEARGMSGWDFNAQRPYSPMLKPVNGCIGDVKGAIQTDSATTPRASLLNLAALSYGTRTQEQEHIPLLVVMTALM